jgi:sugar phosphate isomerase/epimerase
MRLAIVSDEISKDFRKAVEYGIEWGITDYEIRTLTTGRVPYVANDEINLVKEVVKAHDLNISAISPGLFKISLNDEEQLKLQIEENIYESFRLADRLGTHRVIIFGFKRYEREPQSNYIQVVHILRRMASLAERYGFHLLLENEPGFWADSGVNTAKILDDIDSKNLKANWDPANAAAAGEIPYPYGYLALRKHVRSIHVKDFHKTADNDHEYVVVGDGVVDWQGQLRAVMHGVDVDYITIETHCKPLINNSHRNLVKIIDMLEDYELDESYFIK